MTDLLAARSQMAISLGFHILFAVAGMAMPVLMTLAEFVYLRTKDAVWLDLAHRWAKGTAILFAVGAVSGTVLSFELGLLWPEFMRHAGPLVGIPFSLEGYAFFLEAIFLGLYLYGWKRLDPRVHLACGVGVATCGVASAVFVTAVNAWMNEPVGFVLEGSQLVEVDPFAALFSDAFVVEALHMVLAAFAAVAIAVLGIHSAGLLRAGGNPLHERAFKLTLAMGIVCVPLLVASGDIAAKHLARHQPLKLAAAEALFETTTMAPASIGGWPDLDARELRGAIEIPGGLSFLAHGNPWSEVRGLEEFDPDTWPPIAIVHVAFQVMIACGTAMLFLVLGGALAWWLGRKPWQNRLFLRAATLAAPLGLVAIEAGWTVTEVGRQPWIIRGVMRTADAVTPMPGLAIPLFAFTGLYVFLGVVVAVLLRRHVLAADRETGVPST